MTEPSDHELEGRLRDRLHRRGDRVAVPPDEEDLLTRAGARARRMRSLVAVAAAVGLLAGAAGGFAVARADDPAEVLTAAGDGGGSAANRGPDAAPLLAPREGVAFDPGSGASADWFEQPLGWLSQRTTDDGIELRAHHGRHDIQRSTDPGWEPAPWCFPDGVVRVGVVSDEATGVLLSDRYAAPRDGLDATLHLTGLVEAAPIWVVVAQASDADTVRATFPSGALDTAPVVEGIAVLAIRAPAGREPAELMDTRVVLEARAGADTVARVAIPRSFDGVVESEGVQGECEPPPPELPAAGEQPADAEAARAEVITAYEQLYDGNVKWEDKVHLLEDGDALTPVAEVIGEDIFDGEIIPTTVRVSEVVFDAPDHAWVRFDLLLSGRPYSSDIAGEAVLHDGQWQVARTTWCELARNAGATCPAG